MENIPLSNEGQLDTEVAEHGTTDPYDETTDPFLEDAYIDYEELEFTTIAKGTISRSGWEL